MIEPTEEHRLPRIPGEQAEDQAATRAHDLHRHEHEGVEKGSKFHVQDSGFVGRLSSLEMTSLGLARPGERETDESEREGLWMDIGRPGFTAAMSRLMRGVSCHTDGRKA